MRSIRVFLSASTAFALAACDSEEPASACGGSGVICTYMGTGKAGLGHDGATPDQILLYLPQDLAFNAAGQPFVLDWNNHRVRTVNAQGLVETVIGTGELGDAPAGKANEINLNHPTHILFDAQDRLLLSAWHNSKIMRMDFTTGLIEPICGTGGRDYGGDGGPALTAVLDLPVATAIDSQGRLLIMDQANQRIRRVEADGTIDTIAGPPKDWFPASLTRVCATGDDGMETCKLCKVEEAENPDCEARKAPKPQGFAGDGGPATEAFLYLPFSQSAPPAGRMEMGPGDRLVIADTGNQRIRVLEPDGIIHTVAGSGPDTYDPSFTGGYAGDGGPATEALLKRPTDVAVAQDGTIYIADTDNHCVRRVDPDGLIHTAAGTCGERGFGGDGGKAERALLDRPYGVALDKDGNLYIADTHNHRIRVVYR